MKVIIAGSRIVCSYGEVYRAISSSGFVTEITEVVCGGARGADELGARWAKAHGVPVRTFPADWTKFGKQAGILRNLDMAKYADALIAIWDGESHGTRHMINAARERGLKVFLKFHDKSCVPYKNERTEVNDG